VGAPHSSAEAQGAQIVLVDMSRASRSQRWQITQTLWLFTCSKRLAPPGSRSPRPVDATLGLKDEIDALRRKVAESLDAAAVARLHVEEQESARESVEERLRREAEERATWEQLAQDSEAARIEIVARLAALQAAAEAGPKADILEFVQRGEQAAAKIDLDEGSTRDLIDEQLRDRQPQGPDDGHRQARLVFGARGGAGQPLRGVVGKERIRQKVRCGPIFHTASADRQHCTAHEAAGRRDRTGSGGWHRGVSRTPAPVREGGTVGGPNRFRLIKQT
jgi:hypothetical protein